MRSIPVLTPDQSADWDRRAAAQGIEPATLMETAGRATLAVLAQRFGHRLGRGVLVAAGPGNNGGDGWVLARALHRLDVPVWVAPAAAPASPLAIAMAERARAEGVREVAPDGPWPGVELAVDALLGTGARGAPRPALRALLARLAELRRPVVAVDGPTGVDLGTGVVHDGAAPVTLTVTFGGVRRGHLLARDEMGDVVVVDIGLPPPGPEAPELVSDRGAAAWLPRLHAADHKGLRGRVVVVGGAPGMSGALRLAARAAFAAGAGLVHAVAPRETIDALTTAEPDLQTLAHPLEGEPSAAFGALIEQADAVVIGPGLGRAAGRRNFVCEVLARARAAVLDADGLTVFQGARDALATLAAGRALVLTPHPGEFRTLFPELAGQREVDPWGAAEHAAAELGATLLLKGVPTTVARPGRRTRTVAAGNPGLATGGSGDVLSGLAGTLLAQGLDPEIAAVVGAQLLGRGADLAAHRIAARSLRPMDVLAALPDLYREWETAAGRTALLPPILYELPAPVRS